MRGARFSLMAVLLLIGSGCASRAGSAESRSAVTDSSPAVAVQRVETPLTCTAQTRAGLMPQPVQPPSRRDDAWVAQKAINGMRYAMRRDGPGNFGPLYQEVPLGYRLLFRAGPAEFRWMSISRDGVYTLKVDQREWTVPATNATQVRLLIDRLAPGKHEVMLTLTRDAHSYSQGPQMVDVLDAATSECVSKSSDWLAQASGGDALLLGSYFQDEGLLVDALSAFERSDALLTREHWRMLFQSYAFMLLDWEYRALLLCDRRETKVCELPTVLPDSYQPPPPN